MKKISILLTAFFVAAGILFAPLNVHAAEDTDALVKQLIDLYKDGQENAADEIEETLAKLKKEDQELGETWEKIMNYWSYVNTEMEVHVDSVPEGLPEDNSVCIVILGFKLNDDGTMQDELIGRLETGLAIAEAYPNAYVAMTGGGTAKNNPDVTEGDLMGEWLLEQGLDESRLIVEDSAPTTVGNAENTYKILNEQYPDVDSVVMVTSDYHVPRGCILFYSKFMLEAHKTGGEPIEIIASAGYGTGSEGYESIALQASGVASVAGVETLATLASGVGIDIYKVGMALAAVLVLIVVIIVLVVKKCKRKRH